VPGATIRYQRLSAKNMIKGLSKPVPVKDLSKSGISFFLNGKMNHGEPIMMKIAFPDGMNLKLKGHIRWLNDQDTQDLNTVGIQFFPFGNSRYYNPIHALDYLRSMHGQAIIQTTPTEELN
jgi:hypothetical protein